MKYIKRFNEAVTEDFLLDLREFCGSHLAYLLDEGFIVKIDEPDEYNESISIFLEKKGSKEVVLGSGVLVSIPFNWDEVKDIFIPFIITLSKKYRMCLDHEELEEGKCIVVNTINSDNFELDIEELINSDEEIMGWRSTISDDLNESSINSIAFVIKQIMK
mgnify:CR=1 FL=1